MADSTIMKWCWERGVNSSLLAAAASSFSFVWWHAAAVNILEADACKSHAAIETAASIMSQPTSLPVVRPGLEGQDLWRKDRSTGRMHCKLPTDEPLLQANGHAPWHIYCDGYLGRVYVARMLNWGQGINRCQCYTSIGRLAFSNESTRGKG